MRREWSVPICNPGNSLSAPQIPLKSRKLFPLPCVRTSPPKLKAEQRKLREKGNFSKVRSIGKVAQSQGGHEELMRLPRAHLMWTGGMCGMQRAERAIPDAGKLGSCGWPPEQLTLTAVEVQCTASNFSFFLKQKRWSQTFLSQKCVQSLMPSFFSV